METTSRIDTDGVPGTAAAEEPQDAPAARRAADGYLAATFPGTGWTRPSRARAG